MLCRAMTDLVATHAGTIRELRIGSSLNGGAESFPSVLARCTQLEHLAFVHSFPPAAWLGLSQLHTLHDVDLSQVSVTAIAAALPRLHTLTIYFRTRLDPAAVAGFFTELLPRLRVFHFRGLWPVESEAESAESATALPPPLPRLEELVWVARAAKPAALRRFLGAQPSVMRVPFELIAECLSDRRGTPVEPASSLVARARHLSIHESPALIITHSDMARVLRAAPRLHTFRLNREVRGDTSWLTASAAPAASVDAAFAGIVHPRLRHLGLSFGAAPGDKDCASRLRQTCFPRLLEVTVNGEKFIVAAEAD
jgi:hypothetical protein